MGAFEERTLYAILVRLKKTGLKDLPAALPKLPAYLHKLVDEGVYVAAGEFSDHEGGLVLVRTTTPAEAERCAKAHPFYGKTFAEVTLREWSARWNFKNLMGAGRGRSLRPTRAVAR